VGKENVGKENKGKIKIQYPEPPKPTIALSVLRPAESEQHFAVGVTNPA
jgi:hypothetical protein